MKNILINIKKNKIVSQTYVESLLQYTISEMITHTLEACLDTYGTFNLEAKKKLIHAR